VPPVLADVVPPEAFANPLHDKPHSISVAGAWAGAILSTLGLFAGIAGEFIPDPRFASAAEMLGENLGTAGTLASAAGVAAECLDDGYSNLCWSGVITLGAGGILQKAGGPVAGNAFGALTGWA
jgi:hypothetical protein